jgi:hypothetical protein
MRTNGIQGAKRRGKPWRTTTPDGESYRPADLVERDFKASRPDELWFADFERHEALLNRAVVKGHPSGSSRRAGEAEGRPTGGDASAGWKQP